MIFRENIQYTPMRLSKIVSGVRKVKRYLENSRKL